MLPFEKAFDTVVKSAPMLGTEGVVLVQALNRILAEKLVAEKTLPTNLQ
jgi:molybdopterin biosynthesis enzyme